ncbi:MAG: hypothetical protein ACI923_001477 [Flavobacteriales bacterium]
MCYENASIMINLHLLTKISGYDSNFRKQVLQLIINQFETVRDHAFKFIEEERWNACQILFERYLHDLQPYCQAGFLEELQTMCNTMKTAEDNEIKILCVKRFVNTLQNGLVDAKTDILTADTVKDQAHNIDLDRA